MAEGYNGILSLIKDAMNSVTLYSASGDFTTIGNVHDYERIQNTEGTIYKFKDANEAVVPEWTITRPACAETLDEQIAWRNHTFRIRGYYPVNDAAESEKKFQRLIDDLMRHFRYRDDLANEIWLSGPMSLTRFEPLVVMLDEQLCHYCELELPIQEKVTDD